MHHMHTYSVNLCVFSVLFLQTQTTPVVFSWNDNDPTAEDGSDATRHQIRGAASVNLLGGLVNPPPEPSDTQSFTLRANNVCTMIIFFLIILLAIVYSSI